MRAASSYRKHLMRGGEPRTIRKSVSCEPLLDFSSSDDDDRAGGALLTYGSLTPSPAGKRLLVQKSASEAARSRPGSADSFQVGTNTDDDVFAEENGSVSSFDESSAAAPTGDTPEAGNLAETGVSSVDAQGIYPPTACIFAANLAQMYDDKTLEFEVTRIFSQFGPVFVKIRRDSRQMPFAFCQFTADDDAQNAERYGKGTIILGRPCRTEMARAHASFIVYKHCGDFIDVDEAVSLLCSLREIAKAEELDVNIQHNLRLPPAIVASYKMYDPKRDVLLAFRGNRKYKVIPYDPKSVANHKQLVRTSPNKEQFLSQYDRDRRSVYMGNLPMEMNQETLANLASACGEVVAVVLFKKPVQGNPGKMTCFAFVEFSRPDAADDAIIAFNNKDVSGFRVRVDRKQSRTFETPRRGLPMRSAHYSHSTFPRRRHNQVMEPVSPLHTMFDPPAGHTPVVQKKSAVETATENLAALTLKQTPKTTEESSGQNTAAESKAYTPTPKKSNDGGNRVNCANTETPMPMAPPHAPVHMSWMPPFSPYPYGPPMSPYGPMTPHGPPMYPGYNAAPFYPGMYPEMYPMASAPHMMAPQQMAPQQMAPQQMAQQLQPAPAPAVQGPPATGNRTGAEEQK